MSGLFKFLGMVADIFSGVRSLFRGWKKKRWLKKNEKEEAELEKIFTDLDSK